MRARYQVLVIPFTFKHELEVAIFLRRDESYWQFIAGGGENNEEPFEAAKRESFEEAGIESENNFIKLETISSVPKIFFADHKNEKGLWVIPEYCFAVKVESQLMNISNEHTDVMWVNYDEAVKHLKYDNNKTALWELRQRIIEKDIKL